MHCASLVDTQAYFLFFMWETASLLSAFSSANVPFFPTALDYWQVNWGAQNHSGVSHQHWFCLHTWHLYGCKIKGLLNFLCYCKYTYYRMYMPFHYLIALWIPTTEHDCIWHFTAWSSFLHVYSVTEYVRYLGMIFPGIFLVTILLVRPLWCGSEAFNSHCSCS